MNCCHGNKRSAFQQNQGFKTNYFALHPTSICGGKLTALPECTIVTVTAASCPGGTFIQQDWIFWADSVQTWWEIGQDNPRRRPAGGSPSRRKTTQDVHPALQREHICVLGWPSQSPELNEIVKFHFRLLLWLFIPASRDTSEAKRKERIRPECSTSLHQTFPLNKLFIVTRRSNSCTFTGVLVYAWKIRSWVAVEWWQVCVVVTARTLLGFWRFYEEFACEPFIVNIWNCLDTQLIRVTKVMSGCFSFHLFAVPHLWHFGPLSANFF